MSSDSEGHFQKFGTSPVSDAYFKLVPVEESMKEDEVLRDFLISSACLPEILDSDWKKSEGIIFEITDEGIVGSVGFWSCIRNVLGFS